MATKACFTFLNMKRSRHQVASLFLTVFAVFTLFGSPTANATALWRALQDEQVPVRATIETPNKANLAIDTLILPNHVITDLGQVLKRRFNETRFGSSGNWIWAQNVSLDDIDSIYKRTKRSSWQPVVSCPELLEGSKFIVGEIHCENGSLLRYRGAQVIARIDPPSGYKIRDIISETLVLLQQDSDARYAAGVIEATQIRITKPFKAAVINLTRRLAQGSPSNFDEFTFGMYQTPLGYTYLDTNINSLDDVRFATSATPLPSQQCVRALPSLLFDRYLFSIERVAQEKRLRIYKIDSSSMVLRRDELLAESDALLCADTAYLIKQRATGDEIQLIGITASQPATPVTHPQSGPARIYVVGQTAVAQFADKSIRLFNAGANSFSAALSAAPAFPHQLSSAEAFDSPVREVFTQIDITTDAVRIVDRSRDHASGAVVSTQVWNTEYIESTDFVSPALQVLETPGANVFAISVLESSPTGPIRTTRLLVPSISINMLRPLRSLNGEAASLLRTAIAGQFIYGQSTPDAIGSALLYRWDFSGQLLSQSSIAASNMLGQASGHVLLTDFLGSSRQLRIHNGVNEIWRRPQQTNCTTLQLDNFPALDCLQTVNNVPLSSVVKLNPSTGENLWARVITPVNTTETWRVRQAWIRQGQLFLVSWTNGVYAIGNAQRPGRMSSARVDAGDGTLLSVGPNIELPLSSIGFESRERYLFGDDWLRFVGANLLLEPNVRQRFAVRVGLGGSLSATTQGLSVSSGVGFSETYINTNGNEGPRWYASDGFNFEYQTVARSYPEPLISLPLSLEISERAPAFASDIMNTISIAISNPNNAIAQGARLHTGRMDCIDVDTEQNSLLFDLLPNASLTLTCNVWAEPAANVRLATVEIRQPMNYSGLRSPALGGRGILLASPFKDGFED